MSLQDLEDLAAPPPPSDDDKDAAIQAAQGILPQPAPQGEVPQEALPVPTVDPLPPPPSAEPADPYAYLASRGANTGIISQGLNPTFAGRLTSALMDAERVTGQQARIDDLFRPPAVQAQYYANYKQRPITFGGVTYTPHGRGGLAAPPGMSYHALGEAADLASDQKKNPILDYMHQNAPNYGLAFLTGKYFNQDTGHIQLAPADRAVLARTPPDYRPQVLAAMSKRRRQS